MSITSPVQRRFKFNQKNIAALPPCPPESKSREMEYSDTEIAGFKLLASKTGRKFFYQRYSFNGRKRGIKIGEYPATTVAEGRTRAYDIRATVDRGIDPQEEKRKIREIPTFKSFTVEYLEWAVVNKRSHKADESKIRVHLNPKFGNNRLTEITHRDISLYLTNVAKEKCIATRNRHFSLLSKMFRIAIEHKYIKSDESPMLGLKSMKENNERHRYLSKDEIKRLYDAMEQESNKVATGLFKFLLLTGLRKQEALDAQWKNIDVENKSLLLPKTKGGKARHVSLSDGALNILNELPTINGNPFVFVGVRKGKALNNPTKAFKRVKETAQIEDFKLHDFRHTFSSYVVQSGHSLFTLQELLGHSSPRMSQRYAHMDKATLSNASNEVSGMIAELA